MNINTWSIDKIKTVAYFELLRYLKKKRIYVMIILTALMISLNVLIKMAFNVPIGNDVKGFIASELGSIQTLVILTAIFFAGDSLTSEFEKKTGYILFPNPTSREEIFIGKLIASYLISLVFIMAYYLFVGLETLYYFGSLPIEFFGSLGMALLYLLAIVSFSYIFNAILNSSTIAMVLVFFIYFMIFPIIQSIHSFMGIEPIYVLTYYSDAITEILTPHNPRIQEFKVGDLKIYTFYPDVTIALIVLAIYTITSSIIAAYIFKNRELKQ